VILEFVGSTNPKNNFSLCNPFYGAGCLAKNRARRSIKFCFDKYVIMVYVRLASHSNRLTDPFLSSFISKVLTIRRCLSSPFLVWVYLWVSPLCSPCPARLTLSRPQFVKTFVYFQVFFRLPSGRASLASSSTTSGRKPWRSHKNTNPKKRDYHA